MKMKSDEIINKICAIFKEIDISKRTCSYILQFHFQDLHGNLLKSIVFDLKQLIIYEGKSTQADAVINIQDEDFYNVGCKLSTFDELLNQKRMRIEGNVQAFDYFVERFRLHAAI